MLKYDVICRFYVICKSAYAGGMLSNLERSEGKAM